MKLNKSGFTFVELIGALFICSLLFVFLIPNMVRQYANLSKFEKELEMKEVLYEEISINKHSNFTNRRGQLILQTTIKTSRNFLDFTNYEYALAHKKILEIYNDSSKVERESNFVMMTNKDKKEEVKLVFQGDRVYIAKQKSKDFYAGYILLLKKLKSYSIEQDEDMIHITLRDREDKERNLYLKLKTEEKSKKEFEEKDTDKNNDKQSTNTRESKND